MLRQSIQVKCRILWGLERNQPPARTENIGFIEPETGKGYFFLVLKYLQTIAGRRIGALAYNDSI